MTRRSKHQLGSPQDKPVDPFLDPTEPQKARVCREPCCLEECVVVTTYANSESQIGSLDEEVAQEAEVIGVTHPDRRHPAGTNNPSEMPEKLAL